MIGGYERGVKKHLIAYAKRPLPGYAKTRLGAAIGFEESAGVYARLLYGCLLELAPLPRAGICVELSLASAADLPYFRLAFPEFQVSAQAGADLGARLSHALAAAFASGAEAVAILATDVPDLDRRAVQAAFAALEVCDVVIGPCADGGYYLVGTRQPMANLFADIDWSSSRVLEQTEALARRQGLTVQQLPILIDIDTQEDYQRWLAGRASG